MDIENAPIMRARYDQMSNKRLSRSVSAELLSPGSRLRLQRSSVRRATTNGRTSTIEKPTMLHWN